jgi:hypothetical protein
VDVEDDEARRVHIGIVMNPRRTRPTLTTIADRVAELERRLAAAKAPAEPKAPTRVARGTQDVTDAARSAAAEETLAHRIETLLRLRPMSTLELAEETGDERAARCVAALRRQGKLWNIGDDVTPRWVWVIGDEVETQAIRDQIARLCHLRPYTFHELVAAIGANPNRVKGALTDLKLHRYTKEPVPLSDLGDEKYGIYYYPPSGRVVQHRRRRTTVRK